MNRRITKEMADSASKRMAEKLYSCKIEIVREKMQSLGVLYARLYLPSDVIKVVNDHKDYFTIYHALEFRCYKDDRRLDVIVVSVPIYLPPCGRSINLNIDEYTKLNLLNKELQTLQDERLSFKSKMRTSLYSLKTENKVKECLPEALQFIDFPPVNNLPVPVYTELRDLLKTIK